MCEIDNQLPLIGLIKNSSEPFTENESFKYTYDEYVIRENMLWNYKFWDKIGLTNGLRGEVKDRCSFAFDQMANYLMSITDDLGYNRRWRETYESIIIQVIKMIFERLGDEGKEALYTFDKFRTCEDNFGKELFSIVYPMGEIEDAYPFGSYGVNLEAEIASMIADTFSSAIIDGDLCNVNYLEKQSYITLIKAIDTVDKRARKAIKEISKDVFLNNK
jgi:hypothetical protein